MQTAGVGILGFGTVGAGVVDGLVRHADLLEQRCGVAIQVRRIADLDTESDRGVTVDPAWMTPDAQAVISDPEVQIVVETIGGTTIARSLMLDALQAGKSVVTANKALLAEHGAEIHAAAAAGGGDLYYEASVAGGIPIIKVLRESLIGNRIESVYGILNGTCNYILTRMENEGIAFDDVLREAQEAGFAEAEPSLDIDGIDTAHKAAIIASICFGKKYEFSALSVDGIRGLDLDDVDYAAQFGYRMKLLAVVRQGTTPDDPVQVRVHPALIPIQHMLASVSGAFNAVLVRGDVVGDTLYYGQGAGRFPTASAVISDIVDVARNLATGSVQRVPAMTVDGPGRLQPIGETEVRYYLRLQLRDEPGVLARVTRVLGDQGISIASVIQHENGQERFAPVVFLTQRCRIDAMDTALEALGKLQHVDGDHMVRMIVEDLGA